MLKNIIFTVTTGRAGQETLHNILQEYSLDCLSEFEAPNFKPRLPFFFGNIERKIRRQFFETDELLGRGKVLVAYAKGDYEYIEKVAKKRLKLILYKMEKEKIVNYFDISKFYIRGLYKGFNNIINSYSLVFLVRDPLLNMKSFHNRNKNFFLDNSSPIEKCNLLRIKLSDLSKKELYFWAWSEIFLRYRKLSQSKKVLKNIIFRTEDLNNSTKVENLLKYLGIKFKPIKKIKKINTNYSSGFLNTKVNREDLMLLEHFIDKLPSKEIELIKELKLSLKKNQENN